MTDTECLSGKNAVFSKKKQRKLSYTQKPHMNVFVMRHVLILTFCDIATGYQVS